MLKSNFIVLTALLALITAACAPFTPPPLPTPALPTPTFIPPVPTDPTPVQGTALVTEVDVQVTQNSPLQVTALVRGQLPDAGCTSISGVQQSRVDNALQVTLTTATDPLALCAFTITPFEYAVSLDVQGLALGAYLVRVNGVESSFELLPRNMDEFKLALVDALNLRNYELMKIMMDDSFMIGYWRSEGSEHSPDAAIEQLKTNLLGSNFTITADFPRNLIELLGSDPVAVVKPGVVEASPLLVMGMGPQGRDQAILFTAKLPDGSLYWYGLLFAKDGFVRRDPPVVIQPVDTNAYSTSVKFVMALQDVRLRSGPGSQFSIIGYIAGGQTAKVTGVSADGYWWRVICPDNTVGSCWVSAARNLTKPTDGVPVTPPPDTTAYPTEVKYILALQDVAMRSGPGTQFSQISSIAAGQTAKVTGVSANGNWWRVICPDNTIGSCWVTANSQYTQPSSLDGNADVQSVEIQILESYPLQVNAIARGMLPDAGCTSISSVSQTRSGNVFTIAVTTKTNPQAFCAQMLTPFEQVIPLEVGSLLPGMYIVRVNSVEASFMLSESHQPTNVQFVMAHRDVLIFNGPGTQYSAIGSIASGQTAKVTGVSANGNWWRVICPDNSIGNCWVSAIPADTLPAQ